MTPGSFPGPEGRQNLTFSYNSFRAVSPVFPHPLHRKPELVDVVQIARGSRGERTTPQPPSGPHASVAIRLRRGSGFYVRLGASIEQLVPEDAGPDLCVISTA